MEFLGMYLTDRQNYIGFTYKSPITYLYLFTVYMFVLFPHENFKVQL